MRNSFQKSSVCLCPDQLDPQSVPDRIVAVEKIIRKCSVRRFFPAIIYDILRGFRYRLSVKIMIIVGFEIDSRSDLRVIETDRAGIFTDAIVFPHLAESNVHIFVRMLFKLRAEHGIIL